jgi:STE24 endopeptidase
MATEQEIHVRFARRGLSAFFIYLLFTACTAAFAAQAAPALASQPAATATAQPAPQTATAYSLSPEKLAQARVLSRIRTTLDIVGSLWGLAFLWIFLATGWAARLSAWALRVAKRRWLQGLLFFALFFVLSTLASLPLDLIGHIVGLHYKISVQSWGSWIGDQGKGLALSVVFGSLVLLLFNWLIRR